MSIIKNWLQKENIHLHLEAESELETIRTMLHLAVNKPVVINKKRFVRAVYENEILRASHRGCSGVTFFALTNAVAHPLMLIGRFEKGIGYVSRENKPIDLVILLASPLQFEENLDCVIKLIKDILCDNEFMASVRGADNRDEIYQHFLRPFKKQLYEVIA